jgi:hypothetical protein
MYSESFGNQNSNTRASDQPKHDRPTECVIAQQYSSTKFVSLRFHYRKGKVSVRLKTPFFFRFFFPFKVVQVLNCVTS